MSRPFFFCGFLWQLPLEDKLISLTVLGDRFEVLLILRLGDVFWLRPVTVAGNGVEIIIGWTKEDLLFLRC